MKIFTLLSVCSLLVALPAAAAVYTFNNGSGDTANGITDSSGDAFRSGTTVGQIMTASGTWGNWTSAGPGVIAIGVFNTDSLLGLQKDDLIGAFTNQLTIGTFASGPGGQRGSFSLNPSSPSRPAHSLTNISICLLAMVVL